MFLYHFLSPALCRVYSYYLHLQWFSGHVFVSLPESCVVPHLQLIPPPTVVQWPCFCITSESCVVPRLQLIPPPTVVQWPCFCITSESCVVPRLQLPPPTVVQFCLYWDRVVPAMTQDLDSNGLIRNTALLRRLLN